MEIACDNLGGNVQCCVSTSQAAMYVKIALLCFWASKRANSGYELS